MVQPGSVVVVPGTPDEYTILQDNVIKHKDGSVYTAGSYEFIRFKEDKWKIVNSKFVPTYSPVMTSPNVPSESTRIGQALIDRIGIDAARKLIR